MKNPITVRTALEVATHEAIVREAYRDSVGVWTWSVGLTNATGHNVERYIGKKATMKRCLEVYIWALEKYADDVREAFAGCDLNEEQFAAALSFHWNTGAIKRATWVRHFKEGSVAAARKAFMNWVKPKEITGRRKAERDLFFNGKWSGDGTITEWTHVKSGGRIDWGKTAKPDIRPVLQKLLAGQDGSKHKSDTKTPKPKKTLLDLILGLLTAIFGRKK